jgi:thiol-disulfide isomerase/thioredoxin
VILVRLARLCLKELTLSLLCMAPLVFLSPALAEPRVGERAPPLITSLPSGRPFDLSTLQGRVVLVYFWATNCTACLAEMPMIEKFYRDHHVSGFDVIALSIDSPRVRQNVSRVLKAFSFPGVLLNDANQNGFGAPDLVLGSISLMRAAPFERNWVPASMSGV